MQIGMLPKRAKLHSQIDSYLFDVGCIYCIHGAPTLLVQRLDACVHAYIYDHVYCTCINPKTFSLMHKNSPKYSYGFSVLTLQNL